MMTLFREKVFISDRCISGLMPNLIKKSWMDMGYRVFTPILHDVMNVILNLLELRQAPSPLRHNQTILHFRLGLQLLVIQEYYSDLAKGNIM